MNIIQRVLLSTIALYFLMISYQAFQHPAQVKRWLKNSGDFLTEGIDVLVINFASHYLAVPIVGFSAFLTAIATLLGISFILQISVGIELIVTINLAIRIISKKLVQQDQSEAFACLAYNLVVLSFVLIAYSYSGSQSIPQLQTNQEVEKQKQMKQKVENKVEVKQNEEKKEISHKSEEAKEESKKEKKVKTN